MLALTTKSSTCFHGRFASKSKDLPASAKNAGIYYTPRPISQMLCDWAIRTSGESVLEPSFGGCVFIESAIHRLRTLKNTRPEANIFGCDADPKAFDYLQNVLSSNLHISQFKQADFLTLCPTDFHENLFDVVVGNPPYISLHNMHERQKITADSKREVLGISLQRRASLWAYFIVHSLSYLKEGGRMAWVLPGSTVFSEYGRDLIEQLATKFSRIRVVSIQERCFLNSKTNELTNILVGEGWNQSKKESFPEVIRVVGVQDCERLLSSKTTKRTSTASSVVCLRSSGYADGTKILDQSRKLRCATELGSLSKINIGVVTGANSFFCLSQLEINELRLPPTVLIPCATKFSQFKGVLVNKQSFSNSVPTIQKSHLLCPGSRIKSIQAQKYLDTFPDSLIESNRTFAKRPHWFQPDVGPTPDAFLSYMMANGPKLVFNQCRMQCTNSIHRVYFHKTIQKRAKCLAIISISSSFGQLSAEFVGRSYGSGVLKLEPGEAKQLLIFLPKQPPLNECQKTVKNIHALLSEGKQTDAVMRADDFLFKYVPRLKQFCSKKRLIDTVVEMKAQRHP